MEPAVWTKSRYITYTPTAAHTREHARTVNGRRHSPLEASYPRLLARCGAFDYRKLTKAYWFWEMRRDRARAGPPPDGEDLPPAVRVAFGRGPGRRRRFSGRGAEAGLAKLPPFLARHVATI